MSGGRLGSNGSDAGWFAGGYEPQGAAVAPLTSATSDM